MREPNVNHANVHAMRRQVSQASVAERPKVPAQPKPWKVCVVAWLLACGDGAQPPAGESTPQGVAMQPPEQQEAAQMHTGVDSMAPAAPATEEDSMTSPMGAAQDGPGVSGPGMSGPGMSGPGMSGPGTGEPIAGAPGMQASAMGEPETEDPEAGAAAEDQASGDSGAGDGPPANDPPSGVDGEDPPIECPAPLAPGDHRQEVRHDGRTRTYLVHVPAGYDGAAPVPVVFDFHGYGSSGRGQMGASGFRELSDQHGFVSVYPDGVAGSWHVNGCCGQAAAENLDEIGAVRAIFAQLKEQVCVDPKRVFASGISQGGGMAHHVGCLAADVFAAVAPVSSDIRTEPCEPVAPVAEISFRGTADRLSPYDGGPVGPPGAQYQAIGAEATLARWAMIAECTDSAEPMSEHCVRHVACEGGVEVVLCSIPGGGHVLYDNPARFDVAGAAFELFERQAR